MKSIIIVAMFAILATGMYSVQSTEISTLERTDCPGKITCPINGEVICKDQCPLEATSQTETKNQEYIP